MRRILTIVGLSLCAILAAPSLIRADQVNFDNVVAPADFNQVPSYSPFVTPSITFTNGVVLNDSDFGFLSTTAPNLYATTDQFKLMNGLFLPSTVITGTFTNGTGSGLSLDIINGEFFLASTFTVNLYDSSNNLIDSATISLSGFGLPGDVGTVSFVDSGISYFTVISGLPANNTDFAIDTVNFTTTGTTAAPEPASLTMLGAGLIGLAGFKRNRKRT